MIIYKDILKKLKAAGYTANDLITQKIMGSTVLQNIRDGKPINTETINKICGILECQPNDLMIWYDDEDGGYTFPNGANIRYIMENVAEACEEVEEYISNLYSLEQSIVKPENQNRNYSAQLNNIRKKLLVTLNRLETAEKYLEKEEAEQPDPAEIIPKFWD